MIVTNANLSISSMDIKWCYGDIDLGVELWTASMRLNTKLTLTLRPAATISCSETPDGPIMRYNWPQFGLSIVLHDRGDVILMDDRVPTKPPRVFSRQVSSGSRLSTRKVGYPHLSLNHLIYHGELKVVDVLQTCLKRFSTGIK